MGNSYGYVRVSTREQNKARGVRLGRPPKPLPEGVPNAYRRWRQGRINGAAAARECGMPLASFRYRAGRWSGETGELHKTNGKETKTK